MKWQGKYSSAKRTVRHLLLPVVVLGLVTPPQIHATSGMAHRPNIIVIMADDMGIDDVSCYRKLNDAEVEGGPTCQTPNIDRIAAEGKLFTDFYTGAPTCSPSRAAILTGRNATRVGMFNWKPAMAPSPMHLRNEELTVAELLNEAGYTSGFFGKWHIGGDDVRPSKQGFDYGFYTNQNAEPNHYGPRNFRTDTRGKLDTRKRDRSEVAGLAEDKPYYKDERDAYSCYWVVNEAIHWLDTSRDASKPFHINLFFHEPHAKWAAPTDLVERFAESEKLATYYACIENMDGAIGRILKKLDDMGIVDNTIVMFLSDNGSTTLTSNAPFRGTKAFLFDGGVRSPFVVKWPGRIEPGTVTSTLASSTDILPTLCAITGAQIPADRTIDGVDISDLWTDKAATIQRDQGVFFFRYTHNPICMLRVGDHVLLGYTEKYPSLEVPKAHGSEIIKGWAFKESHMEFLVDLEPVEFELYDMKVDKEQQHDIASENPELVATMKAMMLKQRDEMVEEGGVWEFPPVSEEFKKRKAAYLQKVEEEKKRRNEERKERNRNLAPK